MAVLVEHIDKNAIFRFLDKFFWIVWLAFPAFIWLTFRNAFSEGAVIADIGKVSAACADLIPQVGKFSAAGKLAGSVYLVSNFVLYGILFAIVHLTIHRFAEGQVFVANTLNSLGYLGLILVAWPLFDLIAFNVMSFTFSVTGDLKTYEPNLLFDIGPFGVGLLILTMRTALQHAISMKQDQDLTI